MKAYPLALGEFAAMQSQGLVWLSENRLALLLRDEGGRISQSGRIATLDLDGGALASLLPLPSVGWGIAGAGPGSLVVGVGSLEQNLREVRRTPQGWSAVDLLTEGPFSDRQPVYSPDGRSILFTSDRSGNLDIWRLDRGSGIRPDGADATPVALGDQLVPQTSPDGRFVAFRSEFDDGRRLVRISDGHLLDVSIPFTDRYRWSHEPGTYLWAIRIDQDDDRSILRYPFDPVRETLGPAETVLSGGAAVDAESLGVAEDGSAIAFSSFANRRAQLVRIDGLAGLVK
jgi:hypothetical protein